MIPHLHPWSPLWSCYHACFPLLNLKCMTISPWLQLHSCSTTEGSVLTAWITTGPQLPHLFVSFHTSESQQTLALYLPIGLIIWSPGNTTLPYSVHVTTYYPAHKMPPSIGVQHWAHLCWGFPLTFFIRCCPILAAAHEGQSVNNPPQSSSWCSPQERMSSFNLVTSWVLIWRSRSLITLIQLLQKSNLKQICAHYLCLLQCSILSVCYNAA